MALRLSDLRLCLTSFSAGPMAKQHHSVVFILIDDYRGPLRPRVPEGNALGVQGVMRMQWRTIAECES